jgi:hypothetical protein
MTDFNNALKKCTENSRLSALVIDKFLMYYAADREGLDEKMDRLLSRFQRATRKFEPAWINMIKAQYIAHRIFKAGGLIKKYLHHAAIKALPEEQQIFSSYAERRSLEI